MTKIVIAWSACVLVLAVGCNQADKPGPSGLVSPDSLSAASPEIQALAEKLLGSGAEVLATGDLAKNGKRQALLINRLTKSPTGTATRVLFRRAAVLEQNGSNWNEVLRCDEYLKNPKGFLGGAPLIPITAWQLQFLQHGPDGRLGDLNFTPLPTQGNSHFPTIVVRWNSKASRYQAFDIATAQFQGEVALLETPASELR